jgi:hypothetical protein
MSSKKQTSPAVANAAAKAPAAAATAATAATAVKAPAAAIAAIEAVESAPIGKASVLILSLQRLQITIN